jgi:hypothetical protein
MALLFNNSSMLSQTLQWFFAAFMIFGWGLNSAMAAYKLPRQTLAAALTYLGVNILIAVGIYSYGIGGLLRSLGGILSFTPLDILIVALLDFTIPHELYIVVTLFCVCVLGWVAGVFYRRIHPDPYRPRMRLR